MPATLQQARAELCALGDEAVDALLAALSSSVREVRGNAALTLGQMRAQRAVDAIGEMARADEDATVRPLAVRALADIADTSAPSRLKVLLIEALGSKDMFCRALACTGLGRVGDEHCREALRL
ncbi:MAG: HEAT repeat domain-containing protein, partial [Myxococcales bacterium]|nr:HEAT repeat domain-containing protein [Myxococcales bacterium]